MLSQHDFLFMAHSSATLSPTGITLSSKEFYKLHHISELLFFYIPILMIKVECFFLIGKKNIIVEWEKVTTINFSQCFIISSLDIGRKVYVAEEGYMWHVVAASRSQSEGNEEKIFTNRKFWLGKNLSLLFCIKPPREFYCIWGKTEWESWINYTYTPYVDTMNTKWACGASHDYINNLHRLSASEAHTNRRRKTHICT